VKPFLFSLLFCFLATPIAARELTPQQFAYGIPLTISGRDALYEFLLPTEVYRAATRSDLGDICMFNGLKEVVPFTLFRTAAPPPAPAETLTLPIFPLRGNPVRQATGMSLQVRRDADGSIVRVDTLEDGTTSQRITSYLVDASALKKPVASLVLRWQPRPEGTVGRIRVEGSDDLENWATLVPGAAVLEIRYGDHSLERRVVETGTVRMKYFRLSSAGAGDIPILTTVDARMASPSPEQPRRWVDISASRHQEKPGEYSFDMSGMMPVDRIRILLPQENTLVTATLFSREKETDPWRHGPAALAYRLRVRGEEISGPDIMLDPTPHRYWLVRIGPGGGGLGSGVPVIRFGWIPEKILFAARGSGPFLLAYGSSRSGGCIQGGDELFRQLSHERRQETTAGIAVAGSPAELGGEAALRKPLAPTDLKSAVLWAVLSLGVALLAWMAVRLHRHMQADDSREKSISTPHPDDRDKEAQKEIHP
jgi:hypothetical protein